MMLLLLKIFYMHLPIFYAWPYIWNYLDLKAMLVAGKRFFKRLVLLNEYYPLQAKNCKLIKSDNILDKTYITIKNIIIDLGLVFFGSYAISLYSLANKNKSKKVIDNDGSFKILSNFPLDTLIAIKKKIRKKENN